MRRHTRILFALFCLAALSGSSPACAQGSEGVLRQIDTLAAADERGPIELIKSVVYGIEEKPGALAPSLLSRVARPGLTEKQRAVYVWALGLTRDPAGSEPLFELYRTSSSPLVRKNCLEALANIGEPKAGPVLLGALDGSTDRPMRFGIMALLGRMQYEPALPRTEELLRQDWKTCYWWCKFVFGQYGDQAVPFLLPKITDPDRNVRMNTIFVLGGWLLAPEAVDPLEWAYWKEADPSIRGAILSALEHTTSDLSRIRRHFEGVVARELDSDVLKFARETLDSLETIRAEIVAHAKQKSVSADAFTRAWTELYKSSGREGDYEMLAKASGLADEPKLKGLRARILHRNSDEAWYDYQKVNRIIILNRHAALLEKQGMP